MKATSLTHDNSFGAELKAIGALLEDVGGQLGHREPDTVSLLGVAVGDLEQALGTYLATEERLLSPFAWIPESGVTPALQPQIQQLADEQVEVRLLIDRIRSLAVRYPASQHLNPVLRVSLWDLRSVILRLERHLRTSNQRLVSATRAFNGDTQWVSC
jgi:hypothetical protein